MDRADERGLSPADTVAGATTRFVVEMLAWVLGPWAVGKPVGWPGAGVTLVVLVALPATFNAPGDKRRNGILVPGPVRLLLETALQVAAVVAAFVVGGPLLGLAVIAVVLLAVVTGRHRTRWLLAGTPPTS